ncbi:MAG TPA: RagB/SusD family nutrient uptake outer membrane protein [Anseongella sp.]
MKKLISCLLLFTVLGFSGCKEFLDVEPIDRLTGNNFFKNRQDVESNITGMYGLFFTKINETHFIGAVGEYRAGEVMAAPGGDNYNARRVVEVLGENDLISAISSGTPWDWYNLIRVTDWRVYYQVIQSANILIKALEDGIEELSEAETKRYIAECVFIRSFTYFWMVRLYGDVVYYTDAYHSEPLPREDMVSVINKSIADMKAHKDDLPWTYADPALRGVRASRGGAVALLMNMNMWNAGFDETNQTAYYTETANLGQELIQSGAHSLVPLSEWATVVKGRSVESLFEFFRSINYGDQNSALSPFADHFLRYPFKRPEYYHRVSLAYYKALYMMKLFPSNEGDSRRTLWFEDIYADDGTFMILKYAHNRYASGEEDRNPDNTFLIFRYAGAILLRAEALAELGRDDEAIAMVNMVRTRAEATPYSGGGGSDLKNFIFMERSRELIGEGHHYFDLVRTRRILSAQWTYNVLTLDQFNRGAWTWPLNGNARFNNPFIVLNEYWLNEGF